MRLEIKRICERAVEVLRDTFGNDFKALALFGSAAREEETEYSDIDLFVIIQNIPQSHFQRSTLFSRISALNFKRRVLILAKTEQEFKSHFPSLYLDLGLDGQVLYDTNDFLKQRFEKIRELIEQAGLLRRRVDGNFFWEFKKQPNSNWELTWEGYREFSK
jgi:predicted nucleotidyltransferase